MAENIKTTERQIESELLSKLIELKYTHRPDICDRATLESNFRAKFEALNRVTLTDNEFQRLLETIVTPDVYNAAQTLRSINSFERDDGTPFNYMLVNIRDWCKNDFEVVDQLRINTDNSHQRYDVILLINGVPVLQIELKALAVSPRRAMQQIVDYKAAPGNGYGKTLLCFMQIFVVSNQVNTWYFANNSARHFNFNADERFLPVYQFADEQNRKICSLYPFAEKFLAKCILGQTISRYMVLVASEQKLLMMRPYQIYAVKAIMECIRQNSGNGYIWHTTGSGKTLTSFKASTLLKDNPDIDKCLFVVDRKDLDRQTREEFNRFQENCVEENTNTEALVRRLLSNDYADKVIVTTIQKLGLALDENSKRNKQKEKQGKETYKQRLDSLRQQRVVFIFDECHRSQFGDNHQAIKEFFPNAQLFGFTGTPIFEQNATYQQIDNQQARYRTTEDLFHQCLHEYTITHAIADGNVLRFHVDYFKPEGKTPPRPGEPIAKKKVFETILTKHDAATNGRKFNALLATASINDAIEYFDIARELQEKKRKEDDTFVPLNIACVFSPPAENDRDVQQIQEDLPQEKEDNRQDPEGKKKALERIIGGYNQLFGTNHSIAEFDRYYQDVQKRIKDQQYPNADFSAKHKIDITIVVDMLLTGFDAKYLNTLYVDKNLKHHGLIQAFSRTNRVLNDSKPYGNILDFRQQQEPVEEAIALFSGERASSPRQIWLVEPAEEVIREYKNAVASIARLLNGDSEKDGLVADPLAEYKIDLEAVHNLKGETARMDFVRRFKEVQRLKTQLDQYTDLESEQKNQLEQILPLQRLQELRSSYIEIAKSLREAQNKDRNPNSEIQELDFEFVLFASALIDYDYIMSLLAKMMQQGPGRMVVNRDQLISLIQSDAKFIDERDDIAEYIRSLPTDTPMNEDQIRLGYETFKEEKKQQALKVLAGRHGLAPEALEQFVNEILDRGIFDGEKLSELMAPLDLGWRNRIRAELMLMEELTPLLYKLANGREISGLESYA